jgi:hypothetical protein
VDPDANWEEAIKLAQLINNDDGWGLDEARRLAELVGALDEWMEKGGFPPAAFRQEKT